MAFDFPNSPTVGQTFQGYTWDGEKWVSTASSSNIGGVIRILVFTTGVATYVPSPNMTTALLECQAAGGGGGSNVGTLAAYTSGGGGGGGAYANKLVTAAQVGASQVVTVPPGTVAGATGGTCSIGSLCSAVGGAGGTTGTSGSFGTGGLGGAAASCVGDVTLPGGNGFGGYYATGGAPNQLTPGGHGGGSHLGGPTPGVVTTSGTMLNGNTGTAYGGGGSGSVSNNIGTNGGGGAGSSGLAIITEYGITSLGSSAAQAGAVRYDLPQGLTTTQQKQARDNIAAILHGHLFGLTLSTAGSSSSFSVAAGVAADSTSFYKMVLAAAISKTTAAWAVGSGNGALDTGAIAASTWYHAYLIQRPDTGVVDVLVSLSATAPTLPANYTAFRRIGSMKIDASLRWLGFTQLGDYFLWANEAGDQSGVGSANSTWNVTLSVPPGFNIRALINTRVTYNTGAGTMTFFSPLVPSSLGSATVLAASQSMYMQMELVTDTAAQIRVLGNSNGMLYYIWTYGWIDRRGKDN